MCGVCAAHATYVRQVARFRVHILGRLFSIKEGKKMAVAIPPQRLKVLDLYRQVTEAEDQECTVCGGKSRERNVHTL